MVLFKKSHKYPSTYKTGYEKDTFPVRESDSSLSKTGLFLLAIYYALPPWKSIKPQICSLLATCWGSMVADSQQALRGKKYLPKIDKVQYWVRHKDSGTSQTQILNRIQGDLPACVQQQKIAATTVLKPLLLLSEILCFIFGNIKLCGINMHRFLTLFHTQNKKSTCEGSRKLREKNIKLHVCLYLQGVSLQRSLINYNDCVSCLLLHTLASEKYIPDLWGTCELTNIISELADTILKTFSALTNRKEKTSGSIIVTEPFWKNFFSAPKWCNKELASLSWKINQHLYEMLVL